MSIRKEDKQLVPVNLGAGVDESRADESLLNNAFSRLENVVYLRQGKLSKRDGIKFLNNARYDGGTRSRGSHLAQLRDAVVVFGTEDIDYYSPSANTSSRVGRPSPFDIQSFPIVAGAGNPQQYQSIVCNGYVVAAFWNSTSNEVTAAVFDENTLGLVRGPEVLTGFSFFDAYSFMRVVSVGTYVHVIVFQTTTGVLQSQYISLSSSSTINTGWQSGISETDGTISGGTGPYTFGADSNASQIFVAYPALAGAPNLKSYSNVGAAVSSTTCGSSNWNRVDLKVCDNVWVTGFNGTNVNVAVHSISTLSSVVASGLAFAPTSSNANSMGLSIGMVNGTSCSIVLADKVNGTTYRTMVESGGSLSGAFNVGNIQKWQAVSNPWASGNSTCVVLRDSDLSNGSNQGHKVFLVANIASSTNTFAGLLGRWAIGTAYYPAVSTGGYAGFTLPSQQIKQNGSSYFSGLFPRQKTTALSGTTTGVGFDLIKFNTDPSDYRIASAQFADGLYFSGGTGSCVDGAHTEEIGFADVPDVTFVNTAVAGNITGNVMYCAVYEHVDQAGNVHWSAPNTPTRIDAGTNKKVNVSVTSLVVTNRSSLTDNSSRNSIALYRTANAGSTYYRVTALQDTGATQTYQDDMSDTTLQTQQKLYMQPGTVGTSQARYGTPACRYMINHQDRLVCVADDGMTIWYSAPRVIGEGAWFNPIFTIPIEEGGRITGLCSFDNRLIVFKAGSIFAIEGAGPPENGGSGTEFSPPYKLPVSTGCIDHRSIVATDQGVFFQSATGIEFLDRKLGTTWVGEKVRDIVDSFPVVTSGSVDDDNKVIFTLRAAETENAIGSGALLCYHSITGAWSVDKVEGYGNTSNAGFVSSTFHTDGTTNKLWLLDRLGNLYIQRSTSDGDRYMDTNTTVRMAMETGWIRTQGSLSDRQRVWNAETVLKAKTNASVNLAFAYDYVNTYSTDVRIPHTNTGNSGVHVVKLQPATPQNMAIKLRLTETAPVNGASGGTGEGFEVLGIAFEIAAKPGANDPSSSKKG